MILSKLNLILFQDYSVDTSSSIPCFEIAPHERHQSIPSPPSGAPSGIISPQSSITTGLDVAPAGALPTASIFFTKSIPSTTSPKTTCLPSKCGVAT